MKKKVMNLVMLYNQEQILLAMKKRGFGEGRWNGYGGKVYDGETVEQAALRELQEEANIANVRLTPVGLLRFIFPEPDPKELEVHVFKNDNFHGQAEETEEMKPQWFKRADIPFKQMWPDDEIWVPLLLAGKEFEGSIWFKDESTIIRHDIHPK